MYRGGVTGRILRVNLTSANSTVEELPLDVLKNYLGGTGLGIKYLYDELKPGTDPLGEANKLIIAAGPLTGTSAPCASRVAVMSKSPLTGTAAVALTGGFFPAEMKFAGYDMIIVEGRAEKLTYLWIHDGKVEFRNAEKLTGVMTLDTQLYIKDELGDQNVRVACIGPAGEKLSKMACIINERRAAGRKGLGAVMGSKNLKAIALRGSSEVPIAQELRFIEAKKDMLKAMKESPVLYSEFAKVGTPMVVNLTNELGIFSAKNWSATGEYQPVDKLGVAAQEEFKIRKENCYKCPVGCSQVKRVTSGEYGGFLTEGPEFETIYAFGGQTGNSDLPSIIAADRLCDEFGLDTVSTGVTIGFAMELYEKGLLTEEDTGGIVLNFGNHQAMIQTIRLIALREGIGDLLADGVKAAAEKIGKGSEKFAMHVKGLELPAYDVRGAKAHGLNYATSFNGADHNRGYAFQEIFGIPVPEAVDRFEVKGKGKLCKWNQDIRTVTCDCATMCAFILDTALPATAPQNAAALISAATGVEFTAQEIEKIGERVNNLARLFNAREGFNRSDDTLPERLMKEPLKAGNSQGQCITEVDLNYMLDEYYEARGWDKATGAPTKDKLVELGINT